MNLKGRLFFLGIVASIGATIWLVSSSRHETMEDQPLVEALSDCETPNGKKADGCCVSDSYNNHFCATPPEKAEPNCVMGLGVN